MVATKRTGQPELKKAIDTTDLMILLCSGRKTAVEIGNAAGARIQIGKRVLWNVGKIQTYLDSISK